MIKVVLSLLFLCAIANAGFWSSVAGGMVANSLSGSNTRIITQQLEKKQTNEMKIQQALYGLNFYDSELDGNLNTMNSRTAIEKFQKTYEIKKTGILSDTNKQHLLYLHELYTMLINIESTDKKTRNHIYDEVDKIILLLKGDK